MRSKRKGPPRLPSLKDPRLTVEDCDSALRVLREEAQRARGIDPVSARAIGALTDDWLDKRNALAHSNKIRASYEAPASGPTLEGREAPHKRRS